MLFLSIIMPVYNEEKYIRDALMSVYRQSLGKNKYELIIIDDGSTDNTLKICRNFSKQYADINMYMYAQSNMGVSNARNIGLKKARAKYVTFIDGDDILDVNYLKYAISAFEKNKSIDLISCPRTQDIKKLGKNKKTYCLIEPCFYMYNYMLSNTSKYDGYITNKIFKLSKIRENNIFFRKEITYWEDMLFVEQYLSKCVGNLMLLNKYYYYYRLNKDSATFTSDTTRIIKNKYSKAIVAFLISKYANRNSELYLRSIRIFNNLLIDYKILYYKNTITKGQYLELSKYTNGDLGVALHQANLKKKAKYYFAKICHKILHLI
ncbi:glycosyltransferase (plasmid) [Lactiplantibacillus plantarum]|uniref:glycosyltransferase family 2 protein n=1 Tax=Lactiplantibacillus plantarum TaxID=1590 RepID=UPI0012FA47DF|nr:glycosyltransferase family A protein [Lactiplantibacillus plantarum]QGX67502.1 glycosyltransferase [Lactiplantibacillus plantarum]